MYQVDIYNGSTKTTIHSTYFNNTKLLSGSIKQGINVADNFSFTILPNNIGYDLIKPLQTLVTVTNTKTGRLEFDGFVFMPSEIMDDNGAFGKSYTAVSELGYLTQSAQRHGEYHDISVHDFLQVIIGNHNADVADDPIDKTFEVGIVDVDSSTGILYRYLGYENTLDTIKDKLLDRLGGELRVRKENGVRYIDYVQSIGSHKSTEIRIAKNLKSITKETDLSDIITRLVPLGERIESEDEDATDASQARLTIADVNDGKDYLIDTQTEQLLGTVIVGTKTWDDITQANILKTSGQKWLEENNRLKIQYSIDALDLHILEIDPHAFEVGNWHPVINPVMGINEDLRIIAKTVDIIKPENNDLTIGDQFKKVAEYQVQANKSQRKITDLENTVERQTQRIVHIQTEVDNVNSSLDDLVEAFNNADIPQIEQAVSDLSDAVENLTDAIDNIPDYGLATSQSDGLMAKEDKVKLDLISLVNEIDLDAIRNKLNLITVTQPIDLDDLKQRVINLENN